MMFKLALLVVAITAVSAAEQLPAAPADGTCTPGQAYAKDCNTCVCGPQGTLVACTLMECLNSKARSSPPSQPAHEDLPDYPVQGKCETGVVYKLDCNTCVCGENGVGACTLKGCLTN